VSGPPKAPEGRRASSGDQLSVGSRRETLEHAEVELGLVTPEELDLVCIEVEALRQLRDRRQFGGPVDLSFAGHGSTLCAAEARGIRADPEHGTDNPKPSSGRSPMRPGCPGPEHLVERRSHDNSSNEHA
jgi:hypothetical protein